MFKCTYAGSTVIGHKHVLNDKVCEDANKVYQDDEVLIIAIADGHGSEQYEYSNIGSQLACDLIVDILKDHKHVKDLKTKIEEDLLPLFVSEWKTRCLTYYNKSVKSSVSKFEIIEKFGTTCLFLMLFNNKLIAGKIGDGNLFIVKDKVYYPFGEDYEHSNITKSMISEDVLDDFKVIEQDISKSVIVLSTDGHVNSFGNKASFENHLNTILTLINDSGVDPLKSEIKNLLTKISKDGCGDDISMFVVNVEEV